MTTGPKVTRRDLKEDKVYLTMAGVVDYLVRYRLWIGVAILVVILAFAVSYLAHLRAQKTAEEASWALYQARFPEDTAEKLAALDKVAADYKTTPAGRFAAYLIADTLYEDGRYEEAATAFQTFLENNRNHLLAPSAMEAIGFCHESVGRWTEAIETYQELIRKRPESPAAARVNYRIGLCYERSEQPENAINAYEATLELLPDSLWAEYAAARLMRLRPAVPAAPDAATLETLLQQAETAQPDAAPPEAAPAETATPETAVQPPPAE